MESCKVSLILNPIETVLISSREPPPINTKPEGLSLQEKTYAMSQDTQLFQPPSSYPEAPKNMYYQVPNIKPKPQKYSTVFPWEHHAPKATRVFATEPTWDQPQKMPHQELKAPRELPQALPQESPQEIQPQTHQKPAETQALAEPQLLFRIGQPTPGPLYTRVPYQPSASYDTYDRSNAWDTDPEIQRFIDRQQARRKAVSPGSAHSSPGNKSGSSKITDFPTELERPSLPVTPAPIHRTLGEDSTSLPSAEGVPGQDDWVGVTVDAFSFLLNATYLLWRSTESRSDARRTEAEAAAGGIPARSGVAA